MLERGSNWLWSLGPAGLTRSSGGESFGRYRGSNPFCVNCSFMKEGVQPESICPTC